MIRPSPNNGLISWSRTFAALILAGGATVTTFFVWPRPGPSFGWRAEALLALTCGFVWMVAGLWVVRSHDRIAVALFVTGGLSAFYLTRELVAPVSPYYGLLPFAAACAGGSADWLLWTLAAPLTRSWSLALPLVTVVLVVGAAPLTAPIGIDVELRGASNDREHARMTLEMYGNQTVKYAWRPNVAATNRDSVADVTLLDDSGDWNAFRLVAIAPGDFSTVCEALANVSAELAEREIKLGSLPRFMTHLPVRKPSCSSGSFWRVESR